MRPLEQNPPEISAIVPVGSRHADADEVYEAYRAGLDALGRSYEIIFVLDGRRPEFAQRLHALQQRGERITVIRLTRPFGEATALMAGFERARGDVLVTLPAYFQIEAEEIAKLVEALDAGGGAGSGAEGGAEDGAVRGADIAIARRWPRAGGKLEKLRHAAFHGLVGKLTRTRFRDLGCSARALKRPVADEIALYGDQHRFFALLADRQGFRVTEVDLRQSPKDRREGPYPLKEYAHRVLDILTVLFLVRFTKKPLRFFGMLGVGTFLLGALIITVLVVERVFFAESLADRPALLLASLLAVLGLQLFAIGLLGELIIFTHARQIKDYQVEAIIESPAGAATAGATGGAADESAGAAGGAADEAAGTDEEGAARPVTERQVVS